MKNSIVTKLVIISLLLVFNLNVWGNYFEARRDEELLEIVFLDVGQGDSILVKVPGGYWSMIDTGKDSRSVEQAINTIGLFENDFAFLLITHPDQDHYGGMEDVFNYFNISNLFIFKNEKFIDDLKKIIKFTSEAKDIRLNQESDFSINNVNFNVLWPEKNLNTFSIDDVNSASTGLEIYYKDFSLISMGDLNSENEIKAVNDLKSKNTEILKLSHHGSSTSSSLEFLRQVHPLISIVSAGLKNSYGHPHKEVVENVTYVGSEIIRTDYSGNIYIKTDGEKFFYIKTDESPNWIEYLIN